MNTDYIPASAIGHPHAPWEADICTCPRCKGRGEWYILWCDDEDAPEITPEQYNALPAEQQRYYDYECCPLCDGAGEIDKRYIKNY